MKKLLTLIIVLLFILGGLFAQSKVWDYPIKPGSKEWSELKTLEDRLNVYNIPDDLLRVMSTKHLVKTCLNYPEFRMISTRNSLQQGYDFLKSVFNGFRELEKRHDAGIELLQEYKKLEPTDVKKLKTLVARGMFTFNFTYIELLMAQKTILINLDKTTTMELIKQCISNYESIQKMPEEYSTFGLITQALLLGRIMDMNDYPDFTLKKSENSILSSFVDYTFGGDLNTISDVVNLSRTYLKQLQNE